jgi:hypothetical protein
MSAAAPRMSTITTSKKIKPSPQFHTKYVSWSTTSAMASLYAALGKFGLVLERDDFSSIVIPLRLFV